MTDQVLIGRQNVTLAKSNEKLLKLHEVEEMINFKKSFIYEQCRKGNFPQPIRIGKSARWLLSGVLEWIEQQQKTQSV